MCPRTSEMSLLTNLCYIFALVHVTSRIHVSCAEEHQFFIDYPLRDEEVPPTREDHFPTIPHRNPGELIVQYKFPPLFALPYHSFPNGGVHPQTPAARPPITNFDERFAFREWRRPPQMPVNEPRLDNNPAQHPPQKTNKDVHKLPGYGAARPHKTTKDVPKPETDHGGRLPDRNRNQHNQHNIQLLDFLKPVRSDDSSSEESDEVDIHKIVCLIHGSPISVGKVGHGKESAKVGHKKRPLRPRPPGRQTRTKTKHCLCGVPPKQRIINGKVAPIAKHPWMVMQVMSATKQPYCGGTLINNQYVLTAAHCLDGVTAEEIFITLGHTNFANPGINVTVRKFIQHPKYDQFHFEENDIALIKLSLPLSFYDSFVPRTVCIPETADNYNGESGIITGWGVHDNSNQMSDNLQEATVTIMEHSQCKSKSKYNETELNPNIICGHEKNTDSCQGDSGGPMTVKRGGYFTQAGITSWGIGCANKDYPGVYTKVSQFHSWITQNTGEAIYCNSPGWLNSGGGLRMQVPSNPASALTETASALAETLHKEPLTEFQDHFLSDSDTY